VAILGWLINSLAPLVSAMGWLKYLAPYYYYAGHDPLARGADIPGLIVLTALTLLLTAIAMVSIERRDLRA
jgi:ABC-2 type transport system permease protein